MIAVLVIENKPDKPVVKESDGVLTSWKMMVHREIANILLFESTTQFYAWMRAEWQDRYAGCDFEIHGVEDMRENMRAERTCRNVSEYAEECNHFKCSECGCCVEDCEDYKVYVGMTGGVELPWSYCPHCGRKVVG